ncbi:hypothetical protein BDK51DRAFT_46584 [Blyttiomyces helicus]|uniref:Uncharacterized protein n=1 Tax=Blyttiomyces helicus TaxID=388810 RepID=A0A4P9WGH1_9FUNG|nr:hypothetical protein BDK51DRAFT_46584 [Blyttiomyces helicus]|eukprot:RKO90458.1 hypothetical protein BDK51DRAFT_46584 [Blyttiomyces helicus]
MTQKRSNFVGDSLISGNLAVISSSTPQYQGDGSLEVDGTLYTDILESSTPMGNVSVTSALSFPSQSRPVAPTSGNTLVFADSESDGRMVMMNAAGTVIDLNPLTTAGDLLTFDGVKDTTSRFPGGLPDQLLTYDPRGNSATQLSWKSSALALNSVYSPSDLYIRYATLMNSQGFALTSTATSIPFDKVVRCDIDAYSAESVDLRLIVAGYYEILVKCTVGFSSENDLSVGIDACVELSIETGSGGSYTYLTGTKTYSNFEATNSTTPFDTLTCRFIVSVPTGGTDMRVLVREFQTTTNALLLIPEMTTISAMLLIVDSPSTDNSQYLSFQGMSGTRPTVTSSWSDVPTNTPIIQTNSNDVVSAMNVALADAGLRYIFGKVQTLSGAGIVTIIAEESAFTISMPSSSSENYSWQKASISNNSTQTLSGSIYNEMTLSTAEFMDSDFLQNSEETLTVVSGGTYRVLFSAIVANEDMETFTAMVRLLADITGGEKEILGTSGWKSLTAGSVGNVVVGQSVYLPPGATLMAEEVTISSFTGVPDFGRYYQFVHDEEVVQTTSTVFSLRLAISTGTLASGMYRAGLSFDWDMSNAGVKFESQLLLDGSTVIDQYSDLPVITGTYQKALYTKNVRFELWKI